MQSENYNPVQKKKTSTLIGIDFIQIAIVLQNGFRVAITERSTVNNMSRFKKNKT